MLKATNEQGDRARISGGIMFPLVVEGLRFEDRGRILLDGMSLTLDGTRRTVIIGSNGAGKSLLLRMLHGLITPTGGTIRWAGSAMSPDIRSRQAMVFQRPTLLRRSALSNLEFVLDHLAKSKRGSRANELLAAAKLESVAATPARLLSGGEQQRLNIARALARAPDVLFLDEPSASLDPASTLAIEEMILAAHADGTKIILVTHNIGQARRLADDILVVSHGRVAEHTNAAEFFANPASQAGRAYLEGQLDL